MPHQSPLLIRLAPLVFVLLWSSGFIVAKYAVPSADPLTFLSLRYVFAIALLALMAWAASAPWPHGERAVAHSMMAGVLIHGGYLGGVWWAVAQGVPAGISALITALQPLMTAALAYPLIGERITPRQWAGVTLGLSGILLVLAPKLTAVDAGGLGDVAIPIAVNVAGTLSVTLGTFYQKRFIPTADLRSSTALQFVGALIVTLPIALATEQLRFEVNVTTVLVLAWSVVMLSIAAIGLLMLMIRRGEVARTAALIYLMAPLTALEAFILFGEALDPVQIGGIMTTAVGVWLATRRA